jgi:hypothetical protein
MSGGKGGSTSSTVEVPQYIEDAARRNLARADTISQIGFTPYYGPDVAAFTPMQEAAFQSTAQTAGAFGVPGGDMSMQDISGGMPTPTTYAGGVRGYSSAPMYEESMAEFAARRPGQKALIDSLFIDPYSGVAGSNVGPLVDYTATPGDLGGISAGGGDLVSYPGSGVPGGGNGSALSDAEIANYSQVIADELGMASFDPTRTAESQMTPEQYAQYQSQSMSNPAQLAADNIYMSNLATSGQGSLATGGMTGTTLGGNVASGLNTLSNLPTVGGLLAGQVAETIAPPNVYRDTGSSNRTAMETQLDYQIAQQAAANEAARLASGDPTSVAFDPKQFSADYGSANFEFSDPTFPEEAKPYAGGYVTPAPFPAAPAPTPAPAPSSGTTFVNDYSDPATLAQYAADRAPGGIFYESSGSQRAEAAQRELVQSKDDALAQTIDTSEVINLANRKDTAQQWLSENGYGNYDKDDASDILRSKVADIEKSQLKQGIKDGVVMENDRYSVYVNGTLISSEKRSSEAKAKLASATG